MVPLAASAFVYDPGQSIGVVTIGGAVAFMRIVFGLLVAVSIFFFLTGFIAYILSHEDERHKEEGRLLMSQGLIGLFWFMCAWGVVRLLGYFIFGV